MPQKAIRRPESWGISRGVNQAAVVAGALYGSYAEVVDPAVKLYLRGTAARVQSGNRGNIPPHF